MIFLFLLLSFFYLPTPADFKSKDQDVFFKLENFSSQERNWLNLNPEEFSASAILVKELSGKTLFEKNSYQPRPIASLTKLMSAYLAFLIYQPDDIFVFDEESRSQPGEVGNFARGEKISRDEILKASLVASSNDAIYLLAKTYGLTNFVELMNQKARELGMTKAEFVDPMGISQKNVASAYDLYLLIEKIYSQFPEILNFSTLEKVMINRKILWTTNLLLPKYKKIIVGGKTGFTQEAGECLLMVLKFNNSPFVSLIILNSQDRFGEAEKIIQALKNYYGD